jgi:hypothetical protein
VATNQTATSITVSASLLLVINSGLVALDGAPAVSMRSAPFRGIWSPDLLITGRTVALDEPPASTPATPAATPSRRALRSAAVAAA